MQKKPKISIIIAVYNTKRYLPKLIESLNKQTYKNYELVFVDDGSTDGSYEFLLDTFKECKNVKILKNSQNIGTLLTRYNGFSNCSGDYVLCIDSDDFVHEYYLENFIKQATEKQLDVVIANYIKVKLTVENKYYVAVPSQSRDLEWDNYECLKSYWTDEYRNIGYIFNGKLIKRDVIQKVLKEIEKYKDNLYNITMGEDLLYSSLIYYYAKKVGVCLGSIYFYLITRPDSTTKVLDEKALLKKIDGTLRSLTTVKNVLKEHNDYEKYYEQYLCLANLWKNSFIGNIHKYEMQDTMQELLQKYKILDK